MTVIWILSWPGLHYYVCPMNYKPVIKKTNYVTYTFAETKLR